MPKLLPGGTKKALAEQFAEEAYRIILKPYPDIENDSGPISERKRFMEFVALTREFLRLMSADEQLLQQIMVYYSALRDLSRGATHPILKPADLAHAPPLNSDVWRSRSTRIGRNFTSRSIKDGFKNPRDRKAPNQADRQSRIVREELADNARQQNRG